MVDVLGQVVGVALGVFALLGLVVRYVLLPYLREQLTLTRETHKQVTENKHSNRTPTILDRLEDIESGLDVLALNQLAVLRRLGRHIGESDADREAIWLMLGSLTHEEGRDNDSSD